MAEPLNLLLAEDNPQDTELLLRSLRRAGYEPTWTRVETESDFLGGLHAGLDLILSDYSMPQFTGLRALELTLARQPEIPFIIVSGTIGEETAVEAMRMGATDYLLKDRLGRLGLAVERALEDGRLRRERRQNVVALKQSEEKLRMVTDNARVGLVMVNTDRCYTFANDTYAEILGLASANLIGRRVADVLAPIYEDQIRPRLDRAMAGERVAYELTRPTAEGPRHYAVRYEPTKMVGEVALVVVVLTDITERKQAEEFMQASEARYRTLFECAPDGILIVHPDSHYIDANAAACQMLGYDHAELVTLSARDIVAPVEIPEVAPAIAAIAAKHPHHREWDVRRKDGTIFTADVIATAMPDGNLLAMLRDITERKQSDQRISEQLAELLRWQGVMMGREDRVQSLKAEVNALLARLQERPRYVQNTPPSP